MSILDTGIGAILIRAIQDLAPLLPLAGTAVCQDRVAWGLNLGLLYPAAAPMTIFGSLGIALVGLISLISSIDVAYFHGPTRIRNAGFRASGMGRLLLHVNERKHHLFVVEDRLRTILAKKKVKEVEINVFSPDIVRWNLYLTGACLFFGGFGILPYVYLIRHSLPDAPFHKSWLFPVLRLSGSIMVSVGIQLLFQLRILEETYYRLRFLAADNYLKDAGKSLPEYWDPNRRSKSVFSVLRRHLSNQVQHPDEGPRGLTKEDAKMFLDAIHRLGSFSFHGPSALPLQPPANSAPEPAGQDNPTLQEGERDVDQAERGLAPVDEVSMALITSITLFCAQHLTTLGLVLTQVALLAGGVCIIVGYIGCFGVVQANRDPEKWAGPLVWILLEVGLFFARTTIWSWNPPWDDPKSPIVLEKLPKDQQGGADTAEGALRARRKPSYGIGWALDSVTADDMHALVIGIDDYRHSGSENFCNLKGAVSDGEKVRKYLEETLLVPPTQIRTLYNSAATKEKIVEEIKSLKHRTNITHQAPILIYYAGHSAVSDASTRSPAYLVPYPDNFARRQEEVEESNWLAYKEIVSLLQQVGNERTDNIVLILDCCHAGAMARNSKWESNRHALASPALSSASRRENISSTSGGGHSARSAEFPREAVNLPEIITATASVESRPETQSVIAESTQVSSPISSNNAQSTLVENGNASPKSSSMTAETGEILIGYRSHILLAGAAANQEAYETSQGPAGGKFTQVLLDVLKSAEGTAELKKLTYKELVDRITQRFKDDKYDDKSLYDYQRALCTSIYQDQLLFDGLFKRRPEHDSQPIVRVRYTDE